MKKSVMVFVLVFSILAMASVSFSEDTSPTMFGAKWGSSSQQLMDQGLIKDDCLESKQVSKKTGSILYLVSENKKLKFEGRTVNDVVFIFNHLDQLQGVSIIVPNYETFSYIKDSTIEKYGQGSTADFITNGIPAFITSEWDIDNILINMYYSLNDQFGLFSYSSKKYYDATREFVDKKRKGIIKEM